jgi:hypothetical protein
MEDQGRFISTLPERERLDFFRVLILYCDLNDSRATLFSKLVGDDSEALSKELLNFKHRANFKTLPIEQRQNVEVWALALGNYGNLHSGAVSH